MQLAPSAIESWIGSPYRHKFYFKQNREEAFDFIDKLVDHLHPPIDASVLDVACGHGWIAKLLSQKGFYVTGIDLAGENIEFARKFENERLQFYQHDIRLPFRINYYDYALSLFTGFGYFKTEREHYNAIRTTANSLREDGVFVLDYQNVHYEENHLVHKAEIQVDEANYFVTSWFDETHFYKRILIEDEGLEFPLEFTERIAKLSLGEFNDMLSFHNLQVQDVYGDYKFSTYDFIKSPRLIIVARKLSRKNIGEK